MKEYIYRYIGFESFVDMIQKQALTFVLPSMWEDTAELQAMHQLIKNEPEFHKSALFYSVLLKTHAQCWTRLSESDAMWRIYAYGNKSLRIKIDISTIPLLENVKMVDVEYSDDFKIEQEPGKEEERMLRAFSLKRTAFAHEHEVRLLSSYKFHGTEDAVEHIEGLIALSNDEIGAKIIASRGEDYEKTIEQFIELTNITARQKTKEISFRNIPNFIQGVQVHPLAPQWYVNTVEQYCVERNIVFEGQSQLYTKYT